MTVSRAPQSFLQFSDYHISVGFARVTLSVTQPTGADRSRQEPTGADRISVGLARVTLEAAAWCLVAGSAAAGSSDPHPGWAGRRKPAETS